MNNLNLNDGIHVLLPREKMSNGAKKLRDFYAKKANAPIYQCEFGFYSQERWKSEGYINDNSNFDELFGFDDAGSHGLGQLGWCEAEFKPIFEEKILEDRGEHEVVQDYAGRSVLFFKGRRSGFMPEYLDHPVKDIKTWEENCKWRLNPKTSDRYKDLEQRMLEAKQSAAKGKVISQGLIGGYMYLRSLIGPVDLLYKFYDDPELIHECMKTWFELADTVIMKHQEHVTLDELFLAEDISYNKGLLISPDFIREFLFPYYQQLISNIKARQIDKNRHLFIQIDTDGFSDPVIPVFKEIGMDYLSPLEVASGSDVLKISRNNPELILRGGIDKRLLAEGKDSIDKLIEQIMPVMKARGGYIPTCDHGVPAEVSFPDYIYFRKKMLEYA